MNNKIVMLSLIFIMWQMEMVWGSFFDLPPQVAMLDIFTAAMEVMPFLYQNYSENE